METKSRDECKLLEAFFIACGLDRLKVIDLIPKMRYVKAVIYENFECQLCSKSAKPYSHFIRDILAEFFNRLMNRGLIVFETKCIAKGDSYCKFKLLSEGKKISCNLPLKHSLEFLSDNFIINSMIPPSCYR